MKFRAMNFRPYFRCTGICNGLTAARANGRPGGDASTNGPAGAGCYQVRKSPATNRPPDALLPTETRVFFVRDGRGIARSRSDAEEIGPFLGLVLYSRWRRRGEASSRGGGDGRFAHCLNPERARAARASSSGSVYSQLVRPGHICIHSTRARFGSGRRAGAAPGEHRGDDVYVEQKSTQEPSQDDIMCFGLMPRPKSTYLLVEEPGCTLVHQGTCCPQVGQ
ncbi:unnamed protein product [Pleuronectes platessa]|uniref:Uncharacterized protein n=1 Tax=Pleuronectes platessa TaxID=8262 RepID=A0A9N7UL04_PLEPL|nr:unnamed protein product [Pleuronectes platessa]